jgi:hypothetical protein
MWDSRCLKTLQVSTLTGIVLTLYFTHYYSKFATNVSHKDEKDANGKFPNCVAFLVTLHIFVANILEYYIHNSMHILRFRFFLFRKNKIVCVFDVYT